MNPISSWSMQTFIVTSLMIPVVLSICHLVRNRPAIEHALWVVVLLKFVAPSIVTWPWPLPTLTLQMTQQVENSSLPKVLAAEISSQNSVGPSEPTRFEVASPIVQSLSGKLPNLSIYLTAETILMSIWIIGSFVFAVRQYRRVKRQAALLESGTPAPLELANLVDDVATRMGLTPILLVVVPHISSPFVWCLGHLKLAWPTQMRCGIAHVQARSIIAHELAHLRRKDHWVAWLELVAATIWWWNPMFWFMRRRLRLAAEIACDAVALEVYPDDRCLYAEQLLELSIVSNYVTPALGLNAIATSSRHFERRMSMITSENASGRLSKVGFCLAGLLVVASVPTWSFVEANNNRQGANNQDDRKQADAPAPKNEIKSNRGQNFFVFPIKTALQIRLLGWPVEDRTNARAYVMVNGMAVCNDAGMIDEQALDTKSLCAALAPYRDEKNGVVFMHVHYNTIATRNSAAEKMVVWGLEGLGKECGFKKARGITCYHNDGRFNWAEEMTLFNQKIGFGSIDLRPIEDPIGDDSVQVYPVRTGFSSALIKADCFIDFVVELNGESDNVLPEPLRQSIVKYVEQSKTPNKKTVCFSLSMRNLSDERRDELFKELDVFAKSLGFSGSIIQER